MKLDELEQLCQLMAKHGLAHLQVGDVTLVRPPHVIAPRFEDVPKQTADDEDDVDELTKVMRMDPEAQDAYLALSPTRRP